MREKYQILQRENCIKIQRNFTITVYSRDDYSLDFFSQVFQQFS